MAKVYDPIMCMLVDEPTKAQDELKIKKEDGLWCVYKDGKVVGQSNSEAGAIRIYNRLESGKDSASALDKAITTADGATGDKLYADVKAIYNLFSNILLTYSNEQSVQKLANEGTKKCLELAAKVKGVRDEAIKTCDAVDDIYVRRSNEYYVNVKLGKSNPQISATISRILNKDKRVDGVLGSPGNWDVAIEGKDNAEYIKKILSGVGNIK